MSDGMVSREVDREKEGGNRLTIGTMSDGHEHGGNDLAVSPQVLDANIVAMSTGMDSAELLATYVSATMKAIPQGESLP